MKTKILTTLGIVLFALLIVGVAVYAKQPGGEPKKVTSGKFVGRDASEQLLGLLFEKTNISTSLPTYNTFYLEGIQNYVYLDSQGIFPVFKAYFTGSHCSGTPYIDHYKQSGTLPEETQYIAYGQGGVGLFNIEGFIIHIKTADLDTLETDDFVSKYVEARGRVDSPVDINSSSGYDIDGNFYCKVEKDFGNPDQPLIIHNAVTLTETSNPYPEPIVAPIKVVYEYY